MDGFHARAFLARARREVAGRDRDDDRVLLRARSDGLIPATLQWRYGRPQEEPLLWAPDAIAGAVAHALVGRDRDGLVDRVPPGLRQPVWGGEA